MKKIIILAFSLLLIFAMGTILAGCSCSNNDENGEGAGEPPALTTEAPVEPGTPIEELARSLSTQYAAAATEQMRIEVEASGNTLIYAYVYDMEGFNERTARGLAQLMAETHEGLLARHRESVADIEVIRIEYRTTDGDVKYYTEFSD